jgi:hypothetical protein
MFMGKYDSSLTRVQPAFAALKARTNPWVEDLLALGSRASKVGLPATPGWTGAATSDPVRFEHPCPSPVDYARWLLDDVVQNGRDVSLLQSYGAATQAKRTDLISGDGRVVSEAHVLLSAPGGNLGRGWHIFEGTTMVDCALFFEGVTVFVEGKRTEAHLTTGTTWHSGRHQVVRNLDCLRVEPGRAERWYVMTVVEDDNVTCVADAQALDDTRKTFKEALPHLGATEVDEVRGHYLGYTTWQKIGNMFKLPAYPNTAP